MVEAVKSAGNDQALERTLRERFGLEQFRPGQREVIADVLARRDVLCVMPTGGGKSLCYQLPALLLDGLTLVVSPLIALMKDQVDALTARGLRATLLNSTLDPSEQRARLLEIEGGRYDLVYVAPERFRSGRFVEAMARIRPALLAVDEAHCISEWGHDFRPDYARIGQARRALGMPPCIALTATATDLVRRDIADQLDLREPRQFVTGFDRPNLSYHVVEARKDHDKLTALAEALARAPGPAIVYASSRARCETIGQFLRHDLKRPSAVYHAGLSREDRTAAQESFMDGDVEVVVATNAFGMGVDKADVRSVVHYNLPGTLEAYYQEAGRAGRDGHPARCVLLYAPGDRFLQELFIANEYPPPEAVFRVYEFLRKLDADPIELTHAEIKEGARLDLSEQGVGTALKILEGAGGLERFRPRENMAIVRIHESDEPSLSGRLSPQASTQRIVLLGLEGLVDRRFGEPVYFHPDDFATSLGLERTALTRALKHLSAELPIDYIPPFRGNAVRISDPKRRARDLEVDFTALDQRKRQEYDKLERMITYASTSSCRRAYILGYFGDAEVSACGHCDNCGTDSDGAPPRPDAAESSPIDTAGGVEVLRKALSGVARAKGRFGKTTVAQMLTGSGSEKMARWGLTRLSTFGVLSDFKQAEVAQILDALAAAGLAECTEVDRFRPIINLTEAGWALLKQEDHAPITLALRAGLARKVRSGGLERKPRSAQSSTPSPATSDDGEPAPATAGDPLGDRLRALRTEWAREAKQPAYCIFTNETLDDLVRERPTTPHALAAIKGMGPACMERLGAALLQAISGHPSPRPSEPPRPPIIEAEDSQEEATSSPAPLPVPNSRAVVQENREPAPPPPRQSGAYVSTEEWTWRLLDKGFTPEETAAIRGLEPSAILRHATWVARQGKAVPLGAFLPADTLARWDATRREGDDTPPDDDTSQALWSLYLACRGLSGGAEASR